MQRAKELALIDQISVVSVKKVTRELYVMWRKSHVLQLERRVTTEAHVLMMSMVFNRVDAKRVSLVVIVKLT